MKKILLEIPATADNTVFVVRYAHPNARYRSHFTNIENDKQNAFGILLIGARG